MQRRRAVIAALATIVVPVLACNAFTGIGDLALDDPFAAADGAAPDAASSTKDDSGTSIGPGGDGGTVIVVDDGGFDATSDAAGDAGPLGFCPSLSPAPELCTDFDDNVFPGPWTPTVSGLATASLVTSAFRSSPRALLLGSPGGTSGTAFLSRTFATVAQSEVVLGFAIRAGQQRPIENELAVVFLGSAGGNPYQVQFELLDNGALNFEEEAPSGDGGITEKNDALGVTLTVGQWTRVTITIAMAASSSSVTFAIEGSAPVTRPALAHAYKAAPRVVIGHDSPTTAAYGMHYDDVFVRVK